MESKAHLALEFFIHPVKKFLILAILKDVLIFVELGYDFQETKNRHVSNYNVFFTQAFVVELLAGFIHQLDLRRIMELPNKQKGLSDVFIYRPAISVSHGVSYFGNSVYISHNVRLKNLGALHELVQDAESEDCVGLLPWHHWIDVSTTCHVLADDSSASLSKAESEERPNLDNSLFKRDSLIINLFFGHDVLRFRLFHGLRLSETFFSANALRKRVDACSVDALRGC
jgi:hypothetical protein